MAGDSLGSPGAGHGHEPLAPDAGMAHAARAKDYWLGGLDPAAAA
jgi:hypothetical protein